nr:MAG TPA: hypothetical protein [Caudoviricetes sp.]
MYDTLYPNKYLLSVLFTIFIKSTFYLRSTYKTNQQ